MPSTALAVALVVLWSSGFVGIELAAGTGSAAATLAWRYIVTALVLLVAVAPRRRRPSAREIVQQAVLGLLAHVAFLGGIYGASAAGVDVGTTALVAALQPMLVTAAGRALWGDRVPTRQALGLVLGLGAVALTVGGAGRLGAAVLLPAVGVVGLSCATLLERRWRPGTEVALALTVQVVVAAGTFTAYAVMTGTLLEVRPGPRFLSALVWLVVLSGLGGYATFVLCLRRWGASATSTLLYLTPPVTTLWAWAMFGDAVTGTQLLGLAVGAAAVALAVPRGVEPAPASFEPERGLGSIEVRTPDPGGFPLPPRRDDQRE